MLKEILHLQFVYNYFINVINAIVGFIVILIL